MSEPAPTTAKQPPSMAKAATVATVGVLLAGSLLAGGIYWSLHRFGSKSTCPPATAAAARQTVAPKGPEITGPGWTNIGDAKILKQETAGSSYYLPLGGRCETWLVVRNDTLYAYKARLPGSSCAVIWNQPRHSFICNATKEIVPLTRLPRWPAREITSGPSTGQFEINFG